MCGGGYKDDIQSYGNLNRRILYILFYRNLRNLVGGIPREIAVLDVGGSYDVEFGKPSDWFGIQWAAGIV